MGEGNTIKIKTRWMRIFYVCYVCVCFHKALLEKRKHTRCLFVIVFSCFHHDLSRC